VSASSTRRRIRSLTEALLEGGRIVDEPDEDQRKELARLEDLGLVSLTWSTTMLCVDHGDDFDLEHAWERTCNHRIEVREGHPDDPWREEDDREVLCDSCGRAHWPLRRRRTTYPRVRVGIDDDGVTAWVDGQLRRVAKDVSILPTPGVWRFFQGTSEVYVVLLDRCLGTRYAERAFARGNPVLYVVVDHRRFSRRFIDAEWMRRLFLHDLVDRGVTALCEQLDGLADVPMVCAEPASPPWLPVRAPEPRVQSRVLGAHRLEIHENHAVLDDVVVLPPGASTLLEVLRFFAARWREDFDADKAPDDYCAYSPEEVLDDLLERGVSNTEAVGTVRRNINRLRNTIQRKYVEATGVDVGSDGVVENVPEGGFRLRAGRVLVQDADAPR
jgi:hypothetical protein